MQPFVFSRKESILLISLLGLVLLISYCNYHIRVNKSLEMLFVQEIESSADSSLRIAGDRMRGQRPFQAKETRDPLIKESKLKPFDPNEVSYDQLIAMGFSHRLAINFINFRDKVSPFHRKEDLLRLYLVDSSVYEIVLPYVTLKDRARDEDEQKIIANPDVFESKTAEKPCINGVDSLSLLKVRGIGPVFAGRIIRYRQMLGGYYDYEQLRDVYNLPDSVVSTMQRQFTIDRGRIRTLPVNTAVFSQLLAHPYLDYHDVKSIFALRSHGQIKSIQCIKEAKILEDIKLEQLSPYLSF